MSDLLKSALWYAEHGWYVVPLHNPLFNGGDCVGCTCEEFYRSDKCRDMGHSKYSPEYECPTPGKHPRVGDWEGKATNDPAQIRKWWGRPWGDHIPNVGIAAGKSGLVCFDLDDYKELYEGDNFFTREDEETVTNLTGSGGSHLLFQMPEDATYDNTTGDFPYGIDIRGIGGQFVAPPSLHESGIRYQWENGYGPQDIEVSPLPEKLRAVLDRAQEKSKEITMAQFTNGLPPKPDLAQFNLRSSTVEKINTPGERGKRSGRDFAVVADLVRSGASDDDVLAVFGNYPVGTDGKFAERGEEYLARTIGKARATATAHSEDKAPIESPNSISADNAPDSDYAQPMGVDGIVAEIERIAGDDGIKGPDKWAYVENNLAVPISHMGSAEIIRIRSALGGLEITKTAIKEFLGDCKRVAKERRKEESKRLASQRQNLLSRNDDGRISIQSNMEDFDKVVDNAMDAIRSKNEVNINYPIAYIRGGMLTRIATDENELITTQPFKEAGLKYKLAESARWYELSIGADGVERRKTVEPPTSVVKSVLDMEEYQNFPALAGITSCPTFGIEGILHEEPGYSSATKLFYANGLDIGDTTPTTENIQSSLSLIMDDLLGDFPFKDDASKAHALSLVLLPFVRPMINGPTPLHLIDAPMPGTGKGLLVEACTISSIGGDMPSTQAGSDDDEWRKLLTSALLTGSTHISIDNISTTLDSGKLASALTQPVWSDRMLGFSKEVRIPIRTIWMANGNNVIPSEEIARRIVWIRLDANAERPWDRQAFKHENLAVWAKDHRSELVTACITIVNAWIKYGMQKFTGKRKGSYERWSEVMGGILDAVCIGDFLENDKELFETTVNESSALREFVDKWVTLHGESDVSAGDLFRIASFPDGRVEPGEQWHGLLDSLLGGGGERSRKTAMGKLLSSSRDKVIGDYKIIKRKMKRGYQQWSLSKITEE